MYWNSWTLGFCFPAYPRIAYISLLLVVIDSCSSVDNALCAVTFVFALEIMAHVASGRWGNVFQRGAELLLNFEWAYKSFHVPQAHLGPQRWFQVGKCESQCLVVCLFAALLWDLFAAGKGWERLSFGLRWSQSWTGFFSLCVCHILDLNTMDVLHRQSSIIQWVIFRHSLHECSCTGLLEDFRTS